MEEVIRNKVEYLKRELMNHKHCFDCEVMHDMEAERLSNLIKEECSVKGVSYDNIGGAATVKVTPYINELILKEASEKCMANKYRKERKHIDEFNQINKRLLAVSEVQSDLVISLFFENKKIKQIADIENVSEQAIRDRLDNALLAMLEVVL
ncbi:hypothetical protein ACWG0P_13955 [Amedibacillus sp. YH-ame6]